ncbi:6-bladed beta-propeller [Algoriphagus winogradskyi]|uniref:6-bladed beta-propeller protein n=1 Tax=Algoriphagus winogradskyi TaxID=237017 RepID=A0ABY1PEW0_9BACT|nr:BF3164 family lipoprotein [Algoriphagus winogradskyi]SMP31900.1 6-bladed beta-propeller protein [Algoriphagus winogradskyi]
MNQLKYLFILTLLFFSCGEEKKESLSVRSHTVMAELPAPVENSDLIFEFEEIIRLRNSSEDVLSIDKVVENESGFFVLDKRQNRLSLFDYSGDFIRSFGEMGSGPGEYGAIYDFFIIGDLVYIFSPSDLALITYEVNSGDFKSKSQLKLFAQRIVPVSDHEILIYVSNNPSDSNFNVYLSDLKGNLLKEYFPFDPLRSNSIVSYTGFLVSGVDGQYYCEPFGDSIFKFDSSAKSFDQLFELGFVSGEIKSDRENFEKYTGDYNLDPQNRVRFPGGNFLINQEWMLLEMTFDSKVQYVLQDLKDTSHLYTLSRGVSNEFWRFVRNPLLLNSKNELLFPVDPETFHNYDKEKSSQIMTEIFNNKETTEEDNFYLIRISIK